MKIITITLFFTLCFTTVFGQPITNVYTSLLDFKEGISLNCSAVDTTFEDFFRPSVTTTSCGPVVSSLGDNCFDPEVLPDGFFVSVSGGSNVVWVPSQTFNNTIPYIGAGAFVPYTIITFDPPVSIVGMDYISTEDSITKIRLFESGGVPIDTIDLFTYRYEGTFFGVITDKPISRMELDAPNNGGELIAQFLFGAAECFEVSALENNLKEVINVYPNPANDVINIKTSSNVEIKSVDIYDTLGRLMITKTKNKQVNLSALTKGIYFITINTSQGDLIKKIVKE